GEEEPAVLDGGPHPLPALVHRRVRQADHRHHRHSVADIYFHSNLIGVNAKHGAGLNVGEHGTSSPSMNRREFGMSASSTRLDSIPAHPYATSTAERARRILATVKARITRKRIRPMAEA